MSRTVDVDLVQARGFSMLIELLRAMRPKEWIKNTFVFAAIVFSQQRLWMQADAVLTVIAAFILFCMVASAIYLLNDLVDMEKDRAHPKKRNRPLASGRQSPQKAAVTAAALVIVATPLSVWLDLTYTPPAGVSRGLVITTTFRQCCWSMRWCRVWHIRSISSMW